LKIGVNTLFFIPGEVGGSETYLRETLRAITKSRPDIGIVLFTNVENNVSLWDEFSNFKQIQFSLLNFKARNRYMRIIREQIELPKKARQAGIDVLWSPGYTAPRFTDCPQVVTILDMQYKTHPEDLTPLARLTTDILIRMAVKSSEKILAISEFTKQEIIKYTAASPEKISITPLGVDPAFTVGAGSRNSKKRALSLLGNDCPYLLSVANSYPHKNLHRLAESFALAMNRIPHKLVLVGSARRGEGRLCKALEKVPEDRIVRLEGLARPNLISLYQNADIFIFPSLYEGFGLPVLEAMMAGVPVISTHMGSLKEVGGECIYPVSGMDAGEISAAIEAVHAWPAEKRSAFLADAKEHAESFNWHETAQKTILALESIFTAKEG
jgi:glycosyltransferase involved in cell wall biosynthesis